MTELSFDEDGVDVVYQGTDFHLSITLLEDATQKAYQDITDHEVIKLIEKNPDLRGEPRRIGDILR